MNRTNTRKLIFIPIVQPFDEWLQRENHNVERLIEIILGNDSPKDTQKCYKKHTL